METIKNYLDHMFAAFPQTEEVLQAKKELYSMMEDKYEELRNEGKSENEAIGTVISEFGSIEEIRENLSILKEDKNIEEGHQVLAKPSRHFRTVSLSEAKEYLKESISASYYIALGVFLCIISVVPAILCEGISYSTNFSKNQGEGLGGILMFVLIAIAVSIFIINGFRLKKYEWMKNEGFTMEYTTAQAIKKEKENYTKAFAVFITVGVVLCIISLVPSFLAEMINKNNQLLESVAASCLFLFAGIGVVLFIIAGVRYGSYTVLLQEEEYTVEKKITKESPLVGIVASIYWPLVTLIYLAWSFVSYKWGITWIIWPLAGILFAVICGIINAIYNIKKV